MSQSVASLKTSAILDNLEDVQAFVCQQAKDLGAADALLFKIELVIEELFVNIATHARPGIVPEVEIACALDDSAQAQKPSFCVSLRDWEPPFNPLEAAPIHKSGCRRTTNRWLGDTPCHPYD